MNFNLIDLWYSVRSRWKLVAKIAGLVFAVIAVLTFVQPRKYAATSALLVDLSQVDQASKDTPQVASVIDSIIGTQESVLKSDLVVRDVVRRSGLLTDPKDEKEMQKLSKQVLDQATITHDRESNVITISYMDSDRDLAARIANLFADVFMVKQVELAASPAKGNAAWYDSRTADVRRRYALAQQKLSDFERAHGIIGVDRMDLEGEKLKALSTGLADAEAEAAASKSKAGSTNMPEVAGALSVQGIEQQVANQAAHVQELGKTLGPDHPQMAAARGQLAELRQQLSTARSTQASALTAASGASERRVADLRARIGAQQALMIRLSGVQDQLKVLQQDVDASKQTYDEVRQRYNSAQLQSEISRANTSILNHAAVPILPAKPNVIVWLAAGIVFGMFAGVGTALALELLTPRVRSASGLAAATELDVLADFASDAKAWTVSRAGA